MVAIAIVLVEATCCIFTRPVFAVAPPEIAEQSAAMREQLVEIRRDFHMYPELSNQEVRTAGKVAAFLQQLNLDQLTTGVAHTGVVAVLKGGKPGPVIAIRADMDALPITETLDVPYRSTRRGIKHACGHDAHTTILMGTAKVLAGLRQNLPGTVKFIFQPAEEGPPPGQKGGASYMIEQGVLENPKPDAIIGLHVASQHDVGKVSMRVGPMMASSDRLDIRITGRQSHAAYPHEGLDAITVAAAVVQELQTIRSRRISTLDPLVLTIGTINGGTRHNILPTEVTMTGTLRTFKPEVREKAITLARQIVEGICEAHGTTGSLDLTGSNPAVINDRTLTEQMRASAIRVVGEANVVEGEMRMGAEDFSHYQQHIPGCFYSIGIRNAQQGKTAMIHTPEFDIDEDALPLGVRVMSTLAWDYLESRQP